MALVWLHVLKDMFARQSEIMPIVRDTVLINDPASGIHPLSWATRAGPKKYSIKFASPVKIDDPVVVQYLRGGWGY